MKKGPLGKAGPSTVAVINQPTFHCVRVGHLGYELGTRPRPENLGKAQAIGACVNAKRKGWERHLLIEEALGAIPLKTTGSEDQSAVRPSILS